MFPIEFILLALFTTRTSARSQLLAKCCPPGHIFSGTSDVECVSVSNSTKQLYVLQRNATEGFQGLPRCDEPENIATMPFNSFGSGRLVQVNPLKEILSESIVSARMPRTRVRRVWFLERRRERCYEERAVAENLAKFYLKKKKYKLIENAHTALPRFALLREKNIFEKNSSWPHPKWLPLL